MPIDSRAPLSFTIYYSKNKINGKGTFRVDRYLYYESNDMSLDVVSSELEEI